MNDYSKQTSIPYRFYQYIVTHGLFDKNKKLLVAVSGGVDSIVLFHLLQEFKYKIYVAHCNFHLRNEDSDADELLVKDLCKKYNVPIFIKHFATKEFADKNKISIELTARQLRYDWFKTIALENNCEKIVIAHHANDSIETAIYHLTKGTGLSGFKGINSVSDDELIVRPLLFVTKEELLKYAVENGLQWREDYTNKENKYARNLIRNKVIPALKTINPNIEKSFIDTSERIKQIDFFLKEQLSEIRKRYFHQERDFVEINVSILKRKKWFHTIIWELLKEYGFTYKQLQDLIDVNTEARSISNKDYCIYDYGSKWIICKNEQYDSIIKLQENSTKMCFEDFVIEKNIYDKDEYKIERDSKTAAFDMDKVEYPLTLRYWQNGDVFYPIGKQRFKKNVSDYINSLKIKMPMKKKICVLADKNDKIMWLVGLRLSDLFKIEDKTKNIIEYKLIQK